MDSLPSITSKLQRFWDHHLQKANILLCITGSQVNQMVRDVFSYQAPLYGRAHAQLHLAPLPFGMTREYFPDYSAADRVAVYAMLGGIPAYWQQFDPQRSLAENMLGELLTTNNLMQSEPRLLLQEYVTEPHNYMSVLTAMANGAHTPKEIAGYTGLPNMQVPKYLSVLNDAGFANRRISVTASPITRTGRHHITDPYLRYYFRFLMHCQSQLVLGQQEQALAEMSGQMSEFIGKHTWPELCREWLIRASGRKGLPFSSDTVGSAWTPSAQVAVAGIDRRENTLVLGECKWTSHLANRDVIEELVEKKAQQIAPQDREWRVFFLGFSRSGWTSDAQRYQAELEKRQPKFGNVQVAGMRLLDLNQVDQDLEQWLQPVVGQGDIPF